MKNLKIFIFTQQELDQHDAKIKAKWCDEIIEFIKKNEYCVGDYNIENHYAIATDILKQKLNEMKGEKDEIYSKC